MEAATGAYDPKDAQSAVLKPSSSTSEFKHEVCGYDWSNGIDYEAILSSFKSSGFQATNFGLACEEIDKMV